MIIVRCCRFIVTLSVCLWIAPSVQFALRSRVVVCSIICVVVASFSPLSSLRGEMALLAFLVVGLFLRVRPRLRRRRRPGRRQRRRRRSASDRLGIQSVQVAVVASFVVGVVVVDLPRPTVILVLKGGRRTDGGNGVRGAGSSSGRRRLRRRSHPPRRRPLRSSGRGGRAARPPHPSAGRPAKTSAAFAWTAAASATASLVLSAGEGERADLKVSGVRASE